MTNKKYSLAVAKKLKCTQQKRQELYEKVYRDVNRSLKNGSTMEDVVAQMGSPKELAEKLNAELDDAEKKAYKQKQKKDLLIAIAAFVVFFVAFLWWWWPKTVPIAESEVFTEQTVLAEVEEIVVLVGQDEVEALAEMSNDMMAATLTQMTEEEWEDAKASVSENWGAFQSIQNVEMSEITQMGMKQVSVELDACYEYVTVHYLIGFDSTLTMSSLLMQ